jgi:hypothetical protein
MWKGLTALVIVLILGCAALGFAADRSTTKDRRAAAKVGKAFIAALEQGDGDTATGLWLIGSMPSYDLTACRDVGRRTTTSARRPSLPIVVTSVDYESDCVKDPDQQSHDRVYVESDLYWVYYLGHTRP